eukprot:TRINITY_DN6565_c0_g1_i1.p1 TRINITY_DN6565_c0_g1~~TRINITY_DN6565_c0_g1_i1.p1  ORF type:complete len:119 (+),score=22.17 TRINITY_DN6565_c0_g1_i1:121-477(+)
MVQVVFTKKKKSIFFVLFFDPPPHSFSGKKIQNSPEKEKSNVNAKNSDHFPRTFSTCVSGESCFSGSSEARVYTCAPKVIGKKFRTSQDGFPKRLIFPSAKFFLELLLFDLMVEEEVI